MTTQAHVVSRGRRRCTGLRGSEIEGVKVGAHKSKRASFLVVRQSLLVLQQGVSVPVVLSAQSPSLGDGGALRPKNWRYTYLQIGFLCLCSNEVTRGLCERMSETNPEMSITSEKQT